jgi:hypothetical protein
MSSLLVSLLLAILMTSLLFLTGGLAIGLYLLSQRVQQTHGSGRLSAPLHPLPYWSLLG